MASSQMQLEQGKRRIELMNFRKRHALNCRELARVIGVHPSQITRWEKGDQTIPQWLENFLSCLNEQLPAQRLSASDPQRKERIP